MSYASNERIALIKTYTDLNVASFANGNFSFNKILTKAFPKSKFVAPGDGKSLRQNFNSTQNLICRKDGHVLLLLLDGKSCSLTRENSLEEKMETV